MEKIWACIKNNIVVNTIVADDNFVGLISDDWEYVIRIDQINPRPAISWTYDGADFREPS